MKKLNIIPETIDGGYIGEYVQDDLVRCSWCYLHGELERKVGYDIMSLLKSDLDIEEIDDKWVSDSFKGGIYSCTCMGLDCTFFRWNSGRHYSGLVVLNDDVKAFKYAYDCYIYQSESI